MNEFGYRSIELDHPQLNWICLSLQ